MQEKLSSIDWDKHYSQLNEKGYSLLPALLSKEECAELRILYDEADLYRTTINMQRYRFGKGEYKYFKYPLPKLILELRENLYAPLSVLANRWMSSLGILGQYPASHSEFIKECHSQNQIRPTPLILKYETGGYNTLHQDLYGEIYFPFQVIFVLTQQGKDHEGGELVLTEQTPRAQSKAEVIKPNLGDGIIVTTNFRPVQGSRGYYRTKVKHGVSEVKSGTRYSLGIVFHDAS